MASQTSPRYLVIVYVVTAGQHGDELGSDEEEIVLFAWLVLDVTERKVVAVHCKYVKPRTAEAAANVLSEVSRNEFGLTEEQVKSGQPLEQVIEEFDQYAKSKLDNGGNQSFRLIIDGQLHLRQVLLPEASNKGINLPDYFYSFHDIKKEFRKFYRNNDIRTVEEILNYLTIEPDGSADCVIRKLQNISKILIRLITDGHKFDDPEIINKRLEPGIYSKNELVDGNTVVRARGLPWQSSDQDIAKFFVGLNPVKGGVALCLSALGRRNGEALVRFVNQEHRDMALKRHKHHIGQRYIEVYRASGEDFVEVAGGKNNEALQFLSKGGQVIIRMRGLPYDCTCEKVIEFFSTGKYITQIMDGPEGVLFVRRSDGRATGDAFVLFETEEMASKALLKHRECIGTRYIELFRSSTAEVQQVLNRAMEYRNCEATTQLNLPQIPIIPQPLLPSASRRDCIRLRGLPYEAAVEQILEFLGEHAKSIVFRGVHMVYNSQGQPSGEAFIQMDSEQSAALAAAQRHHKYMNFGKKQRYIEVFQCSIDDMNLVLTGGLPLQRHIQPPPSTAPMMPTYRAYPFISLFSNQSAPVMPPTTTAATALTTSGLNGLTALTSGLTGLNSYYHHYNPIIYWPYPSPPVSPTTYYNVAHPGDVRDLIQLKIGNLVYSVIIIELTMETDTAKDVTGFPAYMEGSVLIGRFIPINKKTWASIDIDGNDSILDCASQVVPLMIKKPNIFPPKLVDQETGRTNSNSGSSIQQHTQDTDHHSASKSKDSNTGGDDEDGTSKDGAAGDDNVDVGRKRGVQNDEVLIDSDNDDKSIPSNQHNKQISSSATLEEKALLLQSQQQQQQLQLQQQQTSPTSQPQETSTNNYTMLTISDYYKSSVGTLLMGIGLSRSKEWYHQDAIRQLKRQIRKQGEKEEVVEDLNRQQHYLTECKNANSIFTFKMRKCYMCDFKTESETAMDGHLSIPHMSNRKEYRCNFCLFFTRDPQIIISHFKDTHKQNCVLEQPPVLYQCSMCPYESSQKAKAATHSAKCMKFFNPDKVQSMADPESEYPAITPKPITQEDIKVYEATLIALRAAAHTQLPNIPGLPKGLQQQMLLMQQQQAAQQNRAMRTGKPILGFKGNHHSIDNVATYQLSNNIKTDHSFISIVCSLAGGHTQLVPVQQKYPQGINSTTHLQAVKGRVIPGSGPSPLMQKGPAGIRPSNTESIDSPAGGKGGTFVICEICDGYIKDLEQLRTHMQWIHKVKIHPKMLASRPPLNCQKCQWRFFTDQGLERHLLGAHGLVTSNMQDMVDQNLDGGRCTICGRISASKLVAHMNQVHRITLRPALLSYKCTVCSATFNLYRLFENHVYMVHSGSVKRQLDDQNQSNLVKKNKPGLNGSTTDCHLKN
ncbi:uncharacterized protein LOC141857360 [Brevipalpus obovatus]|uniref:uncharacterized protein LOC141857360 n=1 Tax=Brevipalpus obovatus TaxID=246614 RepID=UPI003D9E36E1